MYDGHGRWCRSRSRAHFTAAKHQCQNREDGRGEAAPDSGDFARVATRFLGAAKALNQRIEQRSLTRVAYIHVRNDEADRVRWVR